MIVATLVCFRIESWHGSLQPELAFRWSPRPDELLSGIEAPSDTQRADMLAATPQDFPQFLGPDRNSVIRNVQLRQDWSSPPELIWRQAIGAGWSGFAVVNRFAVTLEQRGPNEILACYHAATGKAVWTQQEETRHESVFGYVGPRSTPTIHEGRVYALGATGRLRCVDGADGAVIWSHDLFAENGWDQATAEAPVPWGRSASPLIVDDKVIVPLGGPTIGPWVTLIAFDKLTGKEVWRGGHSQISYASPQLVTLAGVRQIVSVNQDFISSHAIEDGRTLWEHPWNGKSNTNASASQARQVTGNQIYCSKGYAAGSELFEVIPPSDKSRVKENAWATETIWANRNMKTKFSNVAFLDGYAYGLDDGLLACQDLETGQRRWKRGRYGYGQILLVGNNILVLDENGGLHLVKASPDKHQELGEFQALEGQTWNTLCLYGDLLLVRNSQEAACYRLPLRE